VSASNVLATVAIVVTVTLWTLERRGRKREVAQARTDEAAQRTALATQVQGLEDQLTRIADGVALATAPAPDTAELSAALTMQQHAPGPAVAVFYYGTIVISNRGPGRAQLTDVDIMNSPAPYTLVDGPLLNPVEMLADEERSVTLQTRQRGGLPPVELRLRWRDSTGPRERTLNLPVA
jgi:hypothetical protein